MPPEETEVRHWLEKADRDRRMAELALGTEPPMTDLAAFHCQQAAEKLLKTYLVWKQDDVEKTHDLRLLLTRCARTDAAFETLRPQVAPLTAYAVRYRYPGPTDPTVAEVEEALRIVAALVDFVCRRLPSLPPHAAEDDSKGFSE